MIASVVLSLAVLVGVTTYSVWSASRPARPDSSHPIAPAVIAPHPIAPVVIAPGTPESQALGDELGKKAESMFMPHLEEMRQKMERHQADIERRTDELQRKVPRPPRHPNPAQPADKAQDGQ
jgi:hypothetical protein